MNIAKKRVALLLGTYHMGNPGQDMHNVKADDVLAPKRQQEIQEVVKRQLGFRTAAELGHDRIYPVDWNEWIGGVGLGHVYELCTIAHA